MKKCLCFLLISVLLSGCGSQETFETIADQPVVSAAAPMAEVMLELPKEALVPASESTEGRLYLCDGYELLVQTLASGDLDATIRSVTGFGREELTVIQSEAGAVKRYELVWSCLGEAGEQVGRACVLDDGNYHYVLSVLADADRAAELQEVFSEIFGSYSLG